MIHLTEQALFGELRLPMSVRHYTLLKPTPRVLADCLMLVFITAGWAVLRFPLGELSLETGCIVTVPEGVGCLLAPAGFADIVIFYVHGDFLKTQLHWVPATHPLVHHAIAARDGDRAPGVMKIGEARMRQLRPLLNVMAGLNRAPGSEFTLLARTADLLDELSGTRTTGALQDTPARHAVIPRHQVAAAARALRNQIARPWTVEQLAREVAMSESQLTRLFRQELGLSPAAFLWQERTDRMAELLSGTDLSVAEAAYRTGWTSPSAASRAFKRRYGVSPGTFTARIRHSAPPWWPEPEVAPWTWRSRSPAADSGRSFVDCRSCGSPCSGPRGGLTGRHAEARDDG